MVQRLSFGLRLTVPTGWYSNQKTTAAQGRRQDHDHGDPPRVPGVRRRPALLASALEIYLSECLAASTYARVAERDGEVVGVVMGRVEGRPFLPHRTRNRLRRWAHLARVAVTGFGELRRLSHQLEFSRAYARLRRSVQGPIGDELTLFVVDPRARGAGVGKALFNDVVASFGAAGTSRLHLFTDSLCSYGFYEHQGMTRAAACDLTLDVPPLPATVGVYLYTGQVPASASTASGEAAAEAAVAADGERAGVGT